MSSAFKLKVLALGEKESKDFFFKHSQEIIYRFQTNYKLTVGVDIITAECFFNTRGDSATLSLWDIGDQERFTFIRYMFFRGGTGCLLFCNLNLLEGNYNLDELISEVRNHSGNIPIYLVCYLSEEQNNFDISYINSFVELRELRGYFIIPEQIDSVLIELTRDIIANRSESIIDNCKETEIFEERQLLYKFLRFFRKCPICKSINHTSYLKNFFYDTSSDSVKIKKKLMWLMENLNDSLEYHSVVLKFGIPCCSCFKKYVEAN